MRIVILEQKEWKKFSEAAHAVCFKEKRPVEFDRYDYAIVAENDKGVPVAYMTVRELDGDSCYMKHGGVFPIIKDTTSAYLAYEKALLFLKNKYKNISTLVENTNTVMAKFSMKAGLRVTGVRNFKNSILVEYSWNKEE